MKHLSGYLGGCNAFRMLAVAGDVSGSGPLALQTLERAWRHAAGLKFERHGTSANRANRPISRVKHALHPYPLVDVSEIRSVFRFRVCRVPDRLHRRQPIIWNSRMGMRRSPPGKTTTAPAVAPEALCWGRLFGGSPSCWRLLLLRWRVRSLHLDHQ